MKIFAYNQVPSDTTSTNYDALFAMLVRGRFDLFPRGATEIGRKLAAYGAAYPELANPISPPRCRCSGRSDGSITRSERRTPFKGVSKPFFVKFL